MKQSSSLYSGVLVVLRVYGSMPILEVGIQASRVFWGGESGSGGVVRVVACLGCWHGDWALRASRHATYVRSVCPSGHVRVSAVCHFVWFLSQINREL